MDERTARRPRMAVCRRRGPGAPPAYCPSAVPGASSRRPACPFTGARGTGRDAHRPRTAMREARSRASETERGTDWDHRRVACVDGLDDLGVVDALEVDGGDAKVAVAELALDDDERHALVRHLD